MPLVKVEIVAGHTDEYKKSLLDALKDTLSSELGVPGSDCDQRIYEVDNQYYTRMATTPDKSTVVEITVRPGKCRDRKKLFKSINTALESRVGIPRDDVVILLHVLEDENWCIHGHVFD